jgi:carbon monoxide dehydrogenase subunit G
MQLTSKQLLPASQLEAWTALNDISVLKACIPGCDSLVETSENEYELLVVAAIGPVKAKFKGKLRLSDLNAPHGYKLQFEGQGGAAGHGKGSAEVRLEPVNATETELHYSATATVGGKIAQIGSRLVDMAAQRMATEFFTAFTAQLQACVPTTSASSLPTGTEPKKESDEGPGFFGRLRTLVK